MATVLITGGSGLIGERLTELLLQRNYKVIHLSQRSNSTQNVPVFAWNIEKQTIDTRALEQADYIIHLTGASVAEKRWTKKRKKEILDSRVQSAHLLFKTLQQTPKPVKAILSASAIGYYGNRGDELLNEDAAPGKDFLADTCLQWENAVKQFAGINIREVKLRIGIVLAKNGGALPELITPVKFGIVPLFARGKPWYSWIHLDDLCRMLIYAMENESVYGACNAVAPNPVRFKVLMNVIKQRVNRFSISIPVPSFVLRILIGEMSESLIASAKLSNEKICKAGFKFQFENVEVALNDLLG